MGGSGGGGYADTQGSARREPNEDTCRALQFRTNLEPLPNAPVHDVGTVLAVVPTGAGTGTVFVAVDDEGRSVGTIVERTDSLLRCTGLGISYEAEVRDVFLGTHEVQVRASSRTTA